MATSDKHSPEWNAAWRRLAADYGKLTSAFDVRTGKTLSRKDYYFPDETFATVYYHVI